MCTCANSYNISDSMTDSHQAYSESIHLQIHWIAQEFIVSLSKVVLDQQEKLWLLEFSHF